jgi:FlaG/FlaF family flagellin (archaellin)
MDKIDLKSRKWAISPIIATLLLILIAIAAGVVVYAYVSGFIGNSTLNTGSTQTVPQIENSCISVGGTNCGASSRYVALTILNVGTVSFPSSGTISVYLTDVTSSTPFTFTCTSSSTSPGSALSCYYTTGAISGISSGDTVSIKVVMPDGGTGTTTVKAFT